MWTKIEKLTNNYVNIIYLYVVKIEYGSNELTNLGYLRVGWGNWNAI